MNENFSEEVPTAFRKFFTIGKNCEYQIFNCESQSNSFERKLHLRKKSIFTACNNFCSTDSLQKQVQKYSTNDI